MGQMGYSAQISAFRQRSSNVGIFSPSLTCPQSVNVPCDTHLICFLTGMATMYVRYKQVEALMGQNEVGLQRLNRAGLLLGWISSFGMCVVANFQVSAAAGVRFGSHERRHSCLQ